MSVFHRRSIGLLGRIFAIVLLTIVIEFVASTLLYERASRLSVREDEAHRVAEHLVVAVKLLSASPVDDRPALADQLSTDRYEVRWRSLKSASPPIAPALPQMRMQITAWEPDLAARNLRLRLKSPGRNNVVIGALQLADGSWMEFSTAELLDGSTLAINRIFLALVPAVALILLGGVLIRMTLRPLRVLATAADGIGHGEPAILTEKGPSEVRRVIHAFNNMQERITQLIDDRTQALAAVGHDLRTPIARLRLRAEAISEDALRTSVSRDLQEIDAMLASLFAFFGGEADPEPQANIDIAVIMATLVDDAQDRGLVAEYTGPDHFDLVVRPVEIKRALANLVENALRYGKAARLSLLPAHDHVVLRVEDDGPGIPAESLETVLQPFERLDPARARNTDGLGLGLAIVVRAVQRESGTLRLSNRPEGGLRADITLPILAQQH
ncbi:MAG: integral rane sensor signal transduction histidine kinase [Rhizorhabdus sp.]|nr:integral rane sensor signal transduction histidine kinase [Rhizorhabdus sp.]